MTSIDALSIDEKFARVWLQLGHGRPAPGLPGGVGAGGPESGIGVS